MKTSRFTAFTIFLIGCWCAFELAAFAQTQRYTIQIASEESEARAQQIATQLANKGLSAHWVKAEVAGKGTRYRVRFGRFASSGEAKAKAEQAKRNGAITDYVIMAYDAPTQTVALVAAPKVPKPAATTPATSAKPEQAVETVTKSPAVSNEPANEPNKPAPAPTTTKEPELALEKKAEKKAAPSKPAEPRGAEKKLPASAATEAAAAAPPIPIAEPPIPEALGGIDFKNNNWKVVRQSTATDKNLRSVFFYDSMTGWAAGDAGALHRTTDGGKTWKPLLAGAAANILQIQFVSWNHGWLLGEIPKKNEDAIETVLFSTINGGRSWERKSFPDIQSIWFLDVTNGWAVGKKGKILRSNDGGKSWNPLVDAEKLLGLPVESPNYNYGFSSIQFLDNQNGWIIGNFYSDGAFAGKTDGTGNNDSAGSDANIANIGGLFATTDGGTTWQRVPLTVQTQYSSGRITPGKLTAVRFTDRQVGTITGEMLDGSARFFFALHTRDGGATWEQYRTPSRALHSTHFLDPSIGWTAATAPREGGAEAVVYDTTLMRTENGGATWHNDFVARGKRIRGVFFLTSGKGWAVGDRGMILRYEERKKAN